MDSFTLMETLLTILIICSIIGGFGLWIFKIGKSKGSKDKDDELNKSSISSIQKTINGHIKTIANHETRIDKIEKGSRSGQGDLLSEISRLLKATKEGTKRHEN